MTSPTDKQQSKTRQQGSDPQQRSTPGSSSQMQGEGNYDAARDYDDAQRRFVESGKVDGAARAAKPRSEAEEQEMLEAERKGKSRAKEEDPAITRPRRGATKP